MLVVKVELWPGGNPRRAREIGRVGIANISALAERSDYVTSSIDDRGNRHDTVVKAHHRSAGFWPLLARTAAGRSRPARQLTGDQQATADAIAADLAAGDAAQFTGTHFADCWRYHDRCARHLLETLLDSRNQQPARAVGRQGADAPGSYRPAALEGARR